MVEDQGPELRLAPLAGAAIAKLMARKGKSGELATALGLPSGPGGVGAGPEGAAAIALAPGEWLLMLEAAPAEARDGAFAARLAERAAGLGHVSEQSHARRGFVLEGAEAARVLAKGCAIDWRSQGEESALQTQLAHVGVLIRRRAAARFEIWAPSTYAGHVLRFLEAAGREFGIASRTEA